MQHEHRSFLASTALFLAGLAVVVELWPWHLYLALAVLLIGLVVGGMRMVMVWQQHRADLDVKRSKTNGDTQGASSRNGASIRSLPSSSNGDAVPVPQKPAIPSTFSELVREGLIAPGADFLLGFEESSGNPLRMPTIASVGIGGLPGFGKTSTAYLIMLESIVKYNGDVWFLEIDPHLGVSSEQTLYAKTRGLEPFFMQHPGLPNPVGLYGEEEDVRAWVQIWQEEFLRRMQGGEGPMWVLVMDEGAAVFSSDVSKEVSKLLENINRQARKVKMFAIIISQEWKASRTGGSEARDSISAYLLHNMPERISDLLVPSDVAKQTARLTKGEAILFAGGVDSRGRVPFACAEDADKLVSLFRPIKIQALPKITKLLTSPDAVTERL